MRVLFISNFFNHHQKPFSDAMFANLGDGYKFIETSTMSEGRKALGWGMEEYPSYVITKAKLIREQDHYQKLIDEADVVIIGSAPYGIIKNRLKAKKLTFCYSERLYKDGCQYYKIPIRIVRHYLKYTRHKNVYMLCASAYTASDFAKSLAFINKCYKWGYFPETRRYDDVDSIIQAKEPNSLLWVGRFLDLKHPEAPVEIAKRLKNDGYTFSLNFIGNGVLEEKINQMIVDCDLSDCVHMLGSMKPDEVRDHMEKSEIFLFTSDRHEGWGAVLNESLNSGCAVVASHAIGSVPFLIKDGQNGFVYKDGNLDDLYEKVKYLLDNLSARREMSRKAYSTILKEWNAENAAEKLIELSDKVLNGENRPLLSDGVCGRAEILKDSL